MQKLNLICVQKKDEKRFTRQSISYVLLTKDYTVATNTYALIAHKTKALFSDYFVENLKDEDRFLIYRDQWKKLCKNGLNYVFDREKMVIRTIKNGDVVDMIPLETEEKIGKFPNWQRVLPDDSVFKEEVSGVGFRPSLLYNLEQAIYPESKDDYPLFLSFMGKSENGWVENNPIRVESSEKIYPNNNFKAIIMPYRNTNLKENDH